MMFNILQISYISLFYSYVANSKMNEWINVWLQGKTFMLTMVIMMMMIKDDDDNDDDNDDYYSKMELPWVA